MMIRTIIFLMFLLIISACASEKVRQEDLNSWQNHSVSELKIHPYFSTLPMEKRDVNSSEYILNFTEKKIEQVGPSSCVGLGSGFGIGPGAGIGLGSTFCGNNQYVEDNCVHQFTISNDKISNYKVLGKNNCSTNCRNTPQYNSCKK